MAALVKLPRSFFPPFVAMCARLECDPTDLLSVAGHESELQPSAYNVGGKAAGLWQMTPVAAPGMGWSGKDTHSFSLLSAVEQLPHWERYFMPHKGKLRNAAACYVCTYLPALLSLAANPTALLCSARGATDSPIHFQVKTVQGWYTGNPSFDPKKTGEIRVHQLIEAIARSAAALGPVWLDAVQGIAEALAPPAPIDVTDGGQDMPVFITPDPEE